MCFSVLGRLVSYAVIIDIAAASGKAVPDLVVFFLFPELHESW